MKIYLDNCCFNRPYDDQTQIRISLETQAKLYIQDLIKEKKIELVTSYILWYENSQNPYETKRVAISEFIQKNSTEYIDAEKNDEIKLKAEEIMKTGIKMKDAYHVACAIYSSCDCFLTTDNRLLKYYTSEIQMLNPIDFIRRLEEDQMTGDIEIMSRGINCLLEKLGVVETERFIVVINREKFDYTKWQRQRFDNMTSDEFNKAAVAYSKENPFCKK